MQKEVDEAAEFARKSPRPDPATATAHTWAEPINPPLAYADPNATPAETEVQSWLDAVRDGIAEEMRRDPHIIYFGEGTGDRGGTFGHTKGLHKEFGPQRMIDTPICELGFTGASIGASATGCRAVADLMMGDFLWEAGSQIVAPGGQAPLHEQRTSLRAHGRSRLLGHHQERRPAPQRRRITPSGPIAPA